MKSLSILSIFLVVASLLVNCSSDPSDPMMPDDITELRLIGEAAGDGVRVVVFSERAVTETGYNRLQIALFDSASGVRLTDAHVSILPMMHMQTMSHSTPVENPVSNDAVDGYFPAAASFVMPGMWEFKVMFHNHATNEHGEVMFMLDVAASNRIKAITGSDGKLYFVSLLDPEAPVVGMNRFEVAIHYRESMESHPAVTDLQIEMVPTMPAMGHGSPNNVNPTHQSLGHFQGEANFTMNGDWRVDLQLESGSVMIAEVAFDITVR